MPTFPFMQVDAFTTRPLGGNPCAIVFDCPDLDDATYLAIAKEFEPVLLLPIGIGCVIANMIIRPWIRLCINRLINTANQLPAEDALSPYRQPTDSGKR